MNFVEKFYSGCSAIINEKGDIISSVMGLSSENITSKVNLNYKTTFYSKIAGSFYAGGGIVCILLSFLSIIKNK